MYNFLADFWSDMFSSVSTFRHSTFFVVFSECAYCMLDASSFEPGFLGDCTSGKLLKILTLRLFNIAMEHGPFIDDFFGLTY